MQHIIKKQIIDLSLERGLDAFRIQQQVSNYYLEKIVPLLQVAFDAASDEEEIISIDNLEIDLGTINIKEIEKGDWDEKVFKKISEQLIHIKHRLKAKKKTRPLSISDQWIFYMQHGYLPWNVLEINEDWYNKTLEAFASDAAAINNLRNLITWHPDSVRRIVFQNSVSFLKSLVETLTAENQDLLPEIINEIAEIISSNDKNKKHYAQAQKNETIQQLWMQVLQLATLETKLKSAEFVRLLSGNNFSIQQQNEDKIEVKENEIYVSNAGIVLLHPFLNQFFKNLHLIEGSNFINIQSQMKALYLLHYLAAGNINLKEHELVIAKILCAFPLENPVDNLIEITEEELQEADNLIASAIGQWEILKDTSPNGLREGFLQRKGKLFTKNGNLVLQLEQSSIDMLLDHLPWNLSIVRLPWMKDVLKVEWR